MGKELFVGKTKEMLDDGGHLSVDVSLPGCYNSYNLTTHIENWTLRSRVKKIKNINYQADQQLPLVEHL